MATVLHSTVKSVRDPPYLVILSPDDSWGWCEQFAQEGYTVVHIPYPPESADAFQKSLEAADAPLTGSQGNYKSVRFGLLTFGLKQEHAAILFSSHWRNQLEACIHYCPDLENGKDLFTLDSAGKYTPTLFHLAATQEKLHKSLVLLCDAEPPYDVPVRCFPPLAVQTYPSVPSSPPFPLLTQPPASLSAGNPAPTVEPYLRSATNLAYTRTLELLRRELGPHFNLEQLWEKHTYFEFVERDAPKTMATMVNMPYVNHVPTMTGGVGYEELARFYKYHFTGKTVTPPDTELITVSRTVGADRIIDEMIFKCTHTTEIDYFLPGVKPTGKSLEIALVGVVAFRGDKLTFEHIYWDQASVLVQLGLLESKNLPVAGIEVARKVMDPYGLPSNTLMKRWGESEGLGID